MCFICVFACVPCTSLVPVEDRRECHTPKTGLRDAYELMWVLKHLSSTPIMFKQSQIFLVYLLVSHILHPNHHQPFLLFSQFHPHHGTSSTCFSFSVSFQKRACLPGISTKHGLPSCSKVTTNPHINIGRGNPEDEEGPKSRQESQSQPLLILLRAFRNTRHQDMQP